MRFLEYNSFPSPLVSLIPFSPFAEPCVGPLVFSDPIPGGFYLAIEGRHRQQSLGITPRTPQTSVRRSGHYIVFV